MLPDVILAAEQARVVRDTVLLTGPPRSGTTLTGKILATFEGLEYRYEPPGFYALCAAHATGQIACAAAALLVQVYLAEDHLLEAAHGRSLNMRARDDSYFLNQMSEQELHRRWQLVGNRADAISLIGREGRRLAVKMPNVMDAHDMLREAMPEMKTVLVVRNGVDVVRSIVGRGWVSDSGLQSDLWPYRSVVNGVPAPYWVPDRWLAQWSQLSEWARGCIMWTVHAEHSLGLKEVRNLHLCRYEDLIATPEDTVGGISDFLEAPTTNLTWRRVSEIRSDRVNGGSLSDTSALPQEILNWFLDVNSRSGY